MFILIARLSPLFFYIANIYAVPDFSLYHDINDKKKAFFEYLSPKVDEINRDILKERVFINKAIDKIKSNNLCANEKKHIYKIVFNNLHLIIYPTQILS